MILKKLINKQTNYFV